MVREFRVFLFVIVFFRRVRKFIFLGRVEGVFVFKDRFVLVEIKSVYI